MIELRGYNFKYCTDYDYDTYHDCESNGCNDEGICRCGTIENAHIISVNVQEMVNDIISNYYDNSTASKRNSKINSILGGISKDIDVYTIDRILRINKVYEASNWEIQITGGYYGQEIDDVILYDSVAQKIESQIDTAFGIIDLTKRIEYLLNLEYGFILPELKGCSYDIVSVDRDSIVFGSSSQYEKVSGLNLEWYSDKKYHSIRGIVLERKNEFRLIDGYHRCCASESKSIKVLRAKQK